MRVLEAATDDSVPSISRTIVPAGHGYSFAVSAGERFRIVDLHGQQVVDFMAWARTGRRCHLDEKVSMAYTRYHHYGATPSTGDYLWTNRDRELFRITDDTVRVHDMTFMACFPELYEKRGLRGHRACASNIAEAMAPWGMKNHLEVADPFNLFQNTPLYAIKGNLLSSRPGDFIEFEALDDAVVAISCCPYDLDGFNGGKITDVAVMTGFRLSPRKPENASLESDSTPGSA
ncbi:hypothetical protein BDY21DRAFT_340730 [Lineolata rhizophorae]|uniref:DUF1989 domain-containing protein n=1 Tax=Lineolata rhizophorae TaxID=578093 RepID=A0A6A6P3Y9_9PEZI|nr:hypothetical protein BDY21DRAFT_340730 [Lineolata rhizophorae]